MPKRQKDQLSVGIGIEENRGRTRVISSKTTWKEAFTEEGGYKSHDMFKEKPEDEAIEKFRQQLFRLIRENPEVIWPNKEYVPEVNITHEHQNPSNVASTPAQEHRYPVDDVIKSNPCELHVPHG